MEPAGTLIPDRAAHATVRRISSLQIGTGWFPEGGGGLERYYYDLVRVLPTAGVDCVGLVTGTNRAAVDSGGSVQPAAPESAPLGQRLRRIRAVASRAFRTAGDGGPALIASHFALYAFPVLDILGPRPLVVHFHGPWAAEAQVEGSNRMMTSLRTMVERSVYRRASRLIVLSSAFREVLVRTYGIDEKRVRVIPGGLDVARFEIDLPRVEARRALGWPADRPIVLAVRRLVRRMGLENLIEAVADLRRQVPDVLVLIAGKGKLQESLACQVRTAGLEAHVKLVGFIPDAQLPTAYRAADVTIVPTTALEGFGLIAAESLAAGTPALVTPVGGLPEVVQALSNHLVLGGTDAASLAEGMKAALVRGGRLPSARQCREYARTRFNWRAVSEQIRNVYAEACDGVVPRWPEHKR